jgi:acetate kinase
MKLLVLNSGSSSLKFKLFEMDSLEVVTSGIIEEIKENGYLKAILEVERVLEQFGIDSLEKLGGIGHRVVHGGEEFTKSVIVDEDTIEAIRKLIPLAPLHNGANLQGLLEVQRVASKVKQVAVFDTAFHQTIPQEAYMYALPYEFYEKYKIRRYGFHGTSHFYVAKEAAKLLNKKLEECNLITIHLGNGDSICAIKNGKSIDTSMGFTPLEGLIMGTRCGDLDPAIVLYLERLNHYTTDELDRILNKKSGLFGICGESDMRTIDKMANDGDEKAKLAHKMFAYHIKKYIGSYSAILGKVDGIVFTGGIGENDEAMRNFILKDLHFEAKIFVIKTDEEKEIAQQTKALLQ